MVRRSAKPNPYLLYLAYTSPHWPCTRCRGLEKYRGKYMKWWDRLRQERHERQLAMGLVDRAWGLSPRDEGSRPGIHSRRRKSRSGIALAV